MSTRSGRIRASNIDVSPSRTRKGVSPTRSPARTRKSSPPARKTPPPASRSPGRKSPARKSPSRKPASKFPARKSPSRTTKEKDTLITEPEAPVPKSPSKRPPIDSDVAVKLDDLTTKLSSYRSTRSKRFEYSIKDLTSNIKESEFSLDKVNGLDANEVYGLRNRRSVEEVAPRRSSRLREFIDNVPDIRRSMSKSLSQSKSVSKSVSKSIDAYSDEENSEVEFQREKSKLITRKLATPLRRSLSSLTEVASKWEFGGRIGSACLLLLIPLTVFSIVISCKKSCSFNSLLDLSAYKSLQVFFSLQALSFIFVQFVIQAIFVVVPVLGPRSDRMDDTGTKHCFNAFFSSLFTITVLFTMDFFQVVNKDSLLNEYLRLAVISYIFAILLSIVVYLKSRKTDSEELNQYGNTGYTLYDFFMGREIHPFIKKLDVKLWISRISNINTLILLSLIFTQGLHIKVNEKTDLALEARNLTLENLKQLLENVQLKPTIILFSIMQIIYVLNFIMKEYKITTTFFWQCEGVGYLQIVSSALYPFYFTTISKYVADSAIVLSTNTLISASVLFLLGFLTMLISNNIKYEFRKNPLQHSLANLDAMPTFHGKKLLVSNMWGILRHPNYTGDILIHIAFALPGILSGQYVAAAPALLTILMLLHRAWRDHARCQRRYGAAWQRYCKRVPSVIIPKVL
ncbi:lamin B receptor [Anticarsia gemmatalis]|uniref:lamin B receptor n=1 Tax=Anticarsia gemmatalis TaxID=129554 RepID=UPI003F75FD5E